MNQCMVFNAPGMLIYNGSCLRAFEAHSMDRICRTQKASR
jgi:hypothetical protein